MKLGEKPEYKSLETLRVLLISQKTLLESDAVTWQKHVYENDTSKNEE